MKKIIEIAFTAIILAMLLSCGVSQRGVKDSRTGRVGIRDTASVKDSTEYELIVFDPGFEFWLNSRSFTKNQYTNEYLQTINHQYVQEWNRRYSSGDRRIESYIDYSPLTKYDFEFNYRLFMYFRYFEESNKIALIPGSNRRF